jgi:hypothetical protein
MLLVLAGGAAPASAANSISSVATAGGDVIADKTAVVSVSGFRDPATSGAVYLIVHINSPSLPCLDTRALNADRAIAATERTVLPAGDFTDVRLSWTPRTAGSYVMCAYLYDWLPDEQYAVAAPVPIVVRNPQASLAMSLPSDRFRSGATTTLTLTTFAEVDRKVDIAINKAGVACGISYGADQGSRVGSQRSILGGPTSSPEAFYVPSTPGLYHLCGYVDRADDDPSPLVITDGPSFWSGQAKCTLSKAPKKKSKSVKISCTNMVGDIQIQAKSGKKVLTVTRTVVNGKTTVKAGELGLTKKKKSTVKVFQGSRQLGSRILRLGQ